MSYLSILTDYFNKYQDYRLLPEIIFLYNELTPRFRLTNSNGIWYIEQSEERNWEYWGCNQ